MNSPFRIASVARLRTCAALWAIGAILAATPARGAETQFPIKPSSDSRLELVVEKTGLFSGKKHVFTFDRYSGTLLLDPESPERSKVDLTIEANSLVCHDTWVSMKDLRKIMEEGTKNMLAADRFPTISFQSASVAMGGAGKYEVHGTLTIRGTAKPAMVIVNGPPAARRRSCSPAMPSSS